MVRHSGRYRGDLRPIIVTRGSRIGYRNFPQLAKQVCHRLACIELNRFMGLKLTDCDGKLSGLVRPGRLSVS